MPVRPCLDCGKLSSGSRCPDHAWAREYARTRDKRTRRPRVPSEDARRAAVVADWRRQYGDVCPGWRCSPHPSSDLTADHVSSYMVSGSESGPLSVLCRVCNGRKAATV